VDRDSIFTFMAMNGKDAITMETNDRRAFLTHLGQVGAAAGMGALCVQPMGCSDAGAATTSLLAWPLQYEPLDVEHVRKLAHESFYGGGGCCYGAFDGIIRALAEQIGDPFDEFPTDMMRYDAGGVSGFGSLCGTLNGAAAAVNLVTETSRAKAIISELMSWYAATPLPTQISNTYAVNHEFYVDPLMTDASLARNAAGGNLCHMSVTNWCNASGFGSGSTERKERCARITGDVAAKAVELLNEEYAGTFVAVTPLPSAATNCVSCHHEGENPAVGEWTNGKMDCGTCHVDPVVNPH
jgi:hypothetical protein